jgi:hypothetical protein
VALVDPGPRRRPLGQRECRLHNELSTDHSLLLQFFNVPPGRDEPAPAQLAKKRPDLVIRGLRPAHPLSWRFCRLVLRRRSLGVGSTTFGQLYG